ncbi:MAG: hypothetical protein R3195_03345 [Gemmatimonadota bacterium]|nr:hypothetical protein [Gemmatimonadota bacterium]
MPAATAAVLVATACAADPRVGQALSRVGEVGPDHIDGRVRIVGSRPFSRTIVQPDSGDALTLSGPYANEIGRLSGARVRVTGRYEDARLPERSLAATSYEILSVDGDPAIVGLLERDDDGWELRSGQSTTRLASVSEALGERAGALVWVVLDERGGVARYGVLREPPP